MKNNQIIAALTGIFILCALVSCYNVWRFRSGLNQLNDLQQRAAYVKGIEGPLMNALLTDTVEYSKKNPAVTPILQALTNNMSKASAPVPQKTGKK
jgi:hypothetical protein